MTRLPPSSRTQRHLERGALVCFAFTGGEPGLGTPTVSIEREVAGAFVAVMASPSRALVNGPEVIRRYGAMPTVADQPTASKRRHEWTALWETLPDTAGGTYRLVATGRAQANGWCSCITSRERSRSKLERHHAALCPSARRWPGARPFAR